MSLLFRTAPILPEPAVRARTGDRNTICQGPVFLNQA